MEALTATNLGQFLNYGALGAICAWLLLRTDKRLGELAKSTDRLTRSVLLSLIGSPHVEQRVQQSARDILAELDGGE